MVHQSDMDTHIVVAGPATATGLRHHSHTADLRIKKNIIRRERRKFTKQKRKQGCKIHSRGKKKTQPAVKYEAKAIDVYTT